MLKTSFLNKALTLKLELVLKTVLSGNWRIFLPWPGWAGMEAVCWTKGPCDFVHFGLWRKILQLPESNLKSQTISISNNCRQVLVCRKESLSCKLFKKACKNFGCVECKFVFDMRHNKSIGIFIV